MSSINPNPSPRPAPAAGAASPSSAPASPTPAPSVLGTDQVSFSASTSPAADAVGPTLVNMPNPEANTVPFASAGAVSMPTPPSLPATPTPAPPPPSPAPPPPPPVPAPASSTPITQDNTWSLWGDPHAVTGDGLKFDNTLVGDFVTLRSRSGDLMVQNRQEHLAGNDKVTYNTAVAIAMAYGGKTDTVTYDARSGKLTLNGQAMPVKDTFLPTGGLIHAGADGKISVITPEGDSLVIAPSSDPAPHVDLSGTISPARAQGEVSGAVGYFDGQGDQKQDLTLPDGTVAPDVASFLPKWTVSAVQTPDILPGTPPTS